MKDESRIFNDARILILDDQLEYTEAMRRMLERSGFQHCIVINDPLEAVQQFDEIRPDLVLLDLHMEPISGVEVLSQIISGRSPQARPPVLVLTGDTSADAKYEALGAGATDFLAKPIDPVEAVLRIRNLLEMRTLHKRCQAYSHGLEILVERRTGELQKRTVELEGAMEALQRSQQQLIQQERTRALSAMARGLAHELTNGISVIVGFGDLLLNDRSRFPEGSSAREYLEMIVAAGQANGQIVTGLREFYQTAGVPEQWAEVNLSTLVKQAITMTSPKWEAEAEATGRKIAVTIESQGTPRIAGAPKELREVLTTLVLNAVDALPQGGVITLRTAERDGRACVEVHDSGAGMSEEARRRCFEPSYTSQPDGPGVGLAAAQSTVQRHGGAIYVQSAPGEGTTFTLDFPTFSATQHVLQEEGTRKNPPLHILAVDDDPKILEIVSGYLTQDEHSVVTAENAAEALRHFRNEKFGLVITDRAMPQINGDALASRLREIDPEIPILMLTGFADLIESEHSAVDVVLGKPARLADLRRAIRKVMKQHATAQRS